MMTNAAAVVRIFAVESLQCNIVRKNMYCNVSVISRKKSRLTPVGICCFIRKYSWYQESKYRLKLSCQIFCNASVKQATLPLLKGYYFQ